MFKQYLSLIGHHRLNALNSMKIERLDLEWQTKDNDADCGLFLMRHMEVYRGGGPERFDGDLLPECTSQKSQLLELRKKYVAKIVLSDSNLCKASFLSTLEEYDKLSRHMKKKIYSQGHLDEVSARIKSVEV